MTWWDKASTEERLAQIDGGLECGLTARQVAMASRAVRSQIVKFAGAHGRHFPMTGSGTPSHQRKNKARVDRSAFFRGEPVDMWGNEVPKAEFPLDEVAA